MANANDRSFYSEQIANEQGLPRRVAVRYRRQILQTAAMFIRKESALGRLRDAYADALADTESPLYQDHQISPIEWVGNEFREKPRRKRRLGNLSELCHDYFPAGSLGVFQDPHKARETCERIRNWTEGKVDSALLEEQLVLLRRTAAFYGQRSNEAFEVLAGVYLIAVRPGQSLLRENSDAITSVYHAIKANHEDRTPLPELHELGNFCRKEFKSTAYDKGKKINRILKGSKRRVAQIEDREPHRVHLSPEKSPEF